MNKRLVSSFIAVVASLTLLAPAAWSQDVSPEITSGSKAMLFTFSGLQNIGAGEYNGGIGGKFYLMDMLALRASLLLGIANSMTAANPGPGMTGTDGSATSWSFGFSAGAEYHFLKTRVSPYAGIQLGLTSTATESKSVEVGNPPAAQTITKNAGANAGMQFNVSALGGVEFFIIKELSLSAEYQLGYALLAHYDQEVVAGNVTTKTKVGPSSYFGIAASGVALTMAFYF
jgi:hypothetical protein